MKKSVFISLLIFSLLCCFSGVAEESQYTPYEPVTVSQQQIYDDTVCFYGAEAIRFLDPYFNYVIPPSERYPTIQIGLVFHDQDGVGILNHSAVYTTDGIPQQINLFLLDPHKKLLADTAALTEDKDLLDAAQKFLNARLLEMNEGNAYPEFELYHHFISDGYVDMIFQAPFSSTLFQEGQFLAATWEQNYNRICTWSILEKPPVGYVAPEAASGN